MNYITNVCVFWKARCNYGINHKGIILCQCIIHEYENWLFLIACEHSPAHVAHLNLDVQTTLRPSRCSGYSAVLARSYSLRRTTRRQTMLTM